MIRRIRSVYLDNDGRKTEETLILEIAVDEEGHPDFKQKSELLGYCKVINEETEKLELYPFVASYSKDYLLADFGDTFAEYSKEQLEAPSRPKFARYFHIPIKGLDPKVGKKVVMAFGGELYQYFITRIDDFSK